MRTRTFFFKGKVNTHLVLRYNVLTVTPLTWFLTHRVRVGYSLYTQNDKLMETRKKQLSYTLTNFSLLNLVKTKRKGFTWLLMCNVFFSLPPPPPLCCGDIACTSEVTTQNVLNTTVNLVTRLHRQWPVRSPPCLSSHEGIESILFI